MAYPVYYDGEIRVTPSLTESDAELFAAVVNLQRNSMTQPVFASIEGSPEPDLPYHGGLLEVTDDRSVITPEQDESRPGVGMWLTLLIKHFFQPRGYSLTGQITWDGSDAEDQGCIHIEDNQIDVVDDLILNPGPSWSPKAYASEKLKEAIRQLVDSADNTGCSPDLTVVSAEHIEALKALHQKLNGESKEPHPYNDQAGNGFCFDCGLPESHPESNHTS
jgi:hypothetical protein